MKKINCFLIGHPKPLSNCEINQSLTSYTVFKWVKAYDKPMTFVLNRNEKLFCFEEIDSLSLMVISVRSYLHFYVNF